MSLPLQFLGIESQLDTDNTFSSKKLSLWLRSFQRKENATTLKQFLLKKKYVGDYVSM